MKYIYPLFVFALVGWTELSSQETTNPSLRIIFAGDIMGHDSQIESAKTSSNYNYDTCFSILRPYIENADIAIANLEVTLAGPPYKGYPQFSSPDELADAIIFAGFDILITANNHSLDRGKEGLERTLHVLEEKNLIKTGTFRNETEKKLFYPLIVEKNGIRLALLNYTYGTNGLKTEAPNIVNYIDTVQISLDLKKAKLARPDFIIVTMHWGIEYQRDENEEQQKLARFIAQNGADAIIGSHPHVVQPLKIIDVENKKVPVMYSLGNFISNQRDRYRDGGVMFELTLAKEKNTLIKDIGYLPFWVYKPRDKDGKYHFLLIPSDKDRFFYEQLEMNDPDYENMKVFDQDIHDQLLNFEQIRSAIKTSP